MPFLTAPLGGFAVEPPPVPIEPTPAAGLLPGIVPPGCRFDEIPLAPGEPAVASVVPSLFLAGFPLSLLMVIGRSVVAGSRAPARIV
jgi:hypothetical protein